MEKAMDWYRIIVSRQEFEAGELNVLMGAFHGAYVAKRAPEGMAMLGGWRDDGTSYAVYLTPRSVQHVLPLVEAYSAKPIPMPDPGGLSLICGDVSQRSWFAVEFQA